MALVIGQPALCTSDEKLLPPTDFPLIHTLGASLEMFRLTQSEKRADGTNAHTGSNAIHMHTANNGSRSAREMGDITSINSPSVPLLVLPIRSL